MRRFLWLLPVVIFVLPVPAQDVTPTPTDTPTLTPTATWTPTETPTDIPLSSPTAEITENVQPSDTPLPEMIEVVTLEVTDWLAADGPCTAIHESALKPGSPYRRLSCRAAI